MGKEYEQAIGRKQKASVSDRVQAEHRGHPLMVQMMAMT